jgi:hypothetical protein
MRFILTLLTIYFIWQVVKFLFKIGLRYWLKKNGAKAFYYSGGFGQNPFQDQNRKEGEVRVETPASSNQKSDKKTTQNLGEYVDFEEVK